jgi:hypothetical protein
MMVSIKPERIMNAVEKKLGYHLLKKYGTTLFYREVRFLDLETHLGKL